jgi:hypothetical protein
MNILGFAASGERGPFGGLALFFQRAYFRLIRFIVLVKSLENDVSSFVTY